MKDYEKERAIQYALYFVLHQTTVRGVANKFGVSKSYVHNILSQMCEENFAYEGNNRLAQSVKQLLEKNKAERHIRGGDATKRRYIQNK